MASSPGSLRLSADTILFDTLFSTVGSVTLRLKVYNDNGNAIKIGKISLGGGSNSSFKIIINGLETTSVQDQLLLGKDSLYVLVKVTINPQNKDLPYLVTDSILFSSGNSIQKVRLVAWGQDANFLNQATLTGQVTWDSQKPYVVYGNLTIDSLATLTIKEGVKVYFGLGSAFKVKGKLVVNGSSMKPVTFNTSDLNKQMGVYPGQWAGIQFSGISNLNTISWAVISNANDGISIAKESVSLVPDLVVSHTVVKNMTGTALTAQRAYVNLDNSLFSNCAKNSVRIVSGGAGNWVNNTLVSYSFDFFREGTVVYLSDNLDNSSVNDLDLKLVNNIVWGSFTNEITINDLSGSGAFHIQADNNVFKTNPGSLWGNSNILFDFAANRRLRNDTIHFLDTYLYNFRIDSLSPALNKGQLLPGYTDSGDLDAKSRDSQPDIGAFEFKKN
ncbi:MAG: hypothetical protein K2Q22_16365 [Cytophagales bacterium]|nr:hypothetical protein [Cytophagales bacterium]